MRSANRQYFYPVDQLRAVAALMMVMYHSSQLISKSIEASQHVKSTGWWYSHNPVKTFIYEGHSGVALFMVLSGFIFTIGTLGRDVRYGPFMANRLLRIYPLYLVLLFVGLSATHGGFTFDAFFRGVLPVSSFGPADPGGTWGLMFWAVAIEMQFYLIFPLLLKLLNRNGPVMLVRIMLALAAIRLLAYVVNPARVDINGIAYYSILGRLDQFLLGMIGAWVFTRHREWLIRPLLPVSGVAAVAMLWAFNQLHGYEHPAAWRMVWVDLEGLVWAVFIVSYVAALQHRTKWLARGVAKLGETSYSIYLLHIVIVTWVATRLGLVIEVGSPSTAAIITGLAVVIPITIVLSAITYAGIERPFLGLRLPYLKPVKVEGPSDQPVRVT